MYSLGRNIILIFYSIDSKHLFLTFPLSPPYIKALIDKEEQKPTSPDCIHYTLESGVSTQAYSSV